MDLKTFLDAPGAPSRAELCKTLGISQGRLSQLRDSTDWPPDLALRIENATGGALSASTLSPVIAQARDKAA